MFEEHRNHIVLPTVREAFDFLIGWFETHPEYTPRPHRQGYINFAVHIARANDGREPFGIIVNMRSLRFYFRRPNELASPLDIGNLEGRFPRYYQQQNGEISVRITSVAHAISALQIAFPAELTNPEEANNPEYWEGALKRVTVNKFERDPAARKVCISHWGCSCAVCDTNFADRYGELGTDFIHVHHLKPLAEIREHYQLNPAEDMRPVCPNCHAMLHRRVPVISIEELREIIEQRKS